MDTPPDHVADNASASSETTPKKTAKLVRTRSRTAKPKVSKAKAAAADPASEPAKVQAEPAKAPAVFEPTEQTEARNEKENPAEVSSQSFEANRGSDESTGSGSDSDRSTDQGNRGERSYNGNQEQGRGAWKRNKRKRGGRQGPGNWQPNAPVNPLQPGPAKAAPIAGDLPDPARYENLPALDTLAADISSGGGDALFLDELYAFNLADLIAFARNYGARFEGAPNRLQLIVQIFTFAAEANRPIRDRGYIDINEQGAFIVHKHVNYRLYPEDCYLPDSLIHRYGLKRGHQVDALVQVPQGDDRCPAVVRINSVMGMAPEEISKVTPFEELVPYYPLQRILLEAPEVQKDVSMRAVDILTPIGFGQRGLIVAPPRTGKTILLQNIANSISENFPEYTLILLLIDERPEEVTDFRRHTKGEVVSSTFDESPENHVHCAEMVGEKARRLLEQGEHVVILLDSITRLARAYNALTGNQGKTMSGGLESNALQKPKRFFGAARNIEGAGSLTIIGTALVDTGSRMDEIIFEEFKGTGNMELHLDRGLVERRIFPAINIDRSGTRKEELIYHPAELEKIYGLRRAMQGLGPIESMEMLIQRLKKTKSNAEFLLSLR
jgi:transcription termination factor Rho